MMATSRPNLNMRLVLLLLAMQVLPARAITSTTSPSQCTGSYFFDTVSLSCQLCASTAISQTQPTANRKCPKFESKVRTI